MVWKQTKQNEYKFKLGKWEQEDSECRQRMLRRHRLLGGRGAVCGQDVCALPRQLAEQAHALLGRALNHAVAHVEDVVPRPRLHQAARDGLADLVLAAKQHHGVHIALLGSG